MLSYCLVFKRNADNKDSKMIKTKNDRLILSAKCAICSHKKSRFMKEQKGKGLLTNLVRLSQIPGLNILFQ